MALNDSIWKKLKRMKSMKWQEKNAPWSLSDGGTDDSIIIFNPKPLLINIIFFPLMPF